MCGLDGHGKTRNCEICENQLEKELNDQIVRDNEIRAESFDTEIIDSPPTPLTPSVPRASSSLNQEDFATGNSLVEVYAYEKSAVTDSHRSLAMLVRTSSLVKAEPESIEIRER